jgi:hypothetical protein
LGGSKKQATTVQDNSPWSAQQPYLTNAFSQAQDIYNSTKNNGPYTGDFFAQPTQQQLDTFNGALSYANGAGADAANNLTNNGVTLNNAGTAAQTGALSGLQNYNNTDWTAQNIANAQRYASGEDIDGLVSAGMQDAYRVAGENTLPTLYRNAQASGNLDGSRQALAEGVVQRGLNDQAQSLRAQLGAQAYTTGLSNAQMDRQGILAGLLGQDQAGSTAVGQGQAGINSGIAARSGLYDMAGTASDRLQAFNQAAIDNQRAKYDYQQAFPWQNLQNYMGIVGGQNWGLHSVGTNVTEDKPSALSTAGSIVGTGLGLFKMFCDARLKTILIENFGVTNSGVPLHLFYYTDDPERRITIGPLAQEVAQTYPDAVVDHNGILVVDISKLV